MVNEKVSDRASFFDIIRAASVSGGMEVSMDNFYLAIDLGASSGRHILGHISNGRMKTEEIYRFENKMQKTDNHLRWDEKKLFQEIVDGIKKCKELGKIPVSLAIDSWGIDFVLLDQRDQILGSMVSYRDSRTKGMEEKVFRIVSESELYYRTGIQREIFNTIYQLMAVKHENPEYIQNATHIDAGQHSRKTEKRNM